jgi:hypothetical protein
MSCSALQGRGAAEQQQGALRQLRVLQRGDRVGQSRAGGDGHHAGRAGQPGDGIGREHRGGLVARVDDADVPGLGGGEDWRNVSAAQREQDRHAVRAQHRGDPLAAVHRLLP